MATLTLPPYSPVVEAERAARLAVVARLLDDSSAGGILREAIRRSSQAGLVRHLEGVLYVLSESGWVQGKFFDESGAVCLRMGIAKAGEAGFGGHGTDIAVGYCLLLMVQSRVGTHCGSLFAWNDAVGRTEAEVVQLVEDAIVFARSYQAVAS